MRASFFDVGGMMTKWRLPEGRKPLTDADIAALTRRLAGTAIDYKELYQAAKRDAEEAEAYAAELEANINIKADFIDATINQLAASDQHIEELEAKLAKAVETLKRYGGVMPIAFTPIQDGGYKARTTIAELTGGKDE